MAEKEPLEFLKNLIETISPSGSEEEAVNLWKGRTGQFARKTKVDINGNCVAVLNEGKSPKVMLAGHIDEVGFMVKYIDKEGFLYFSSIGGIDLHLVPGQRIRIKTDRKSVV